jgi:LysM repeat protein
MNPIRILAPSLLVVALVSCASQKSGEYDTANPYGTPDAGQTSATATAPANPVYDTPAAYEESSSAPANTAAVPDAAASPAPAPAASSNGAAIIHTVVKGDTLSGISKKYKIPAASIKQANRMTNDTVVLGRKMVIPPR